MRRTSAPSAAPRSSPTEGRQAWAAPHGPIGRSVSTPPGRSTPRRGHEPGEGGSAVTPGSRGRQAPGRCAGRRSRRSGGVRAAISWLTIDRVGLGGGPEAFADGCRPGGWSGCCWSPRCDGQRPRGSNLDQDWGLPAKPGTAAAAPTNSRSRLLRNQPLGELHQLVVPNRDREWPVTCGHVGRELA
jgi:hypothetical protein